MDTRLKDLRTDHDLTQEQCAKIAFISKNSYIRYENGTRVPPLDTIKIFAEYYNVSIDYIAKLTSEKKKKKKKKKKKRYREVSPYRFYFTLT